MSGLAEWRAVAMRALRRFLTYLHAALYSARIYARSIKLSTGIQDLDSASYLNEVAVLPELTEQRAIAHLKELRTALISATVTGKIDVREEAA